MWMSWKCGWWADKLEVELTIFHLHSLGTLALAGTLFSAFLLASSPPFPFSPFWLFAIVFRKLSWLSLPALTISSFALTKNGVCQEPPKSSEHARINQFAQWLEWGKWGDGREEKVVTLSFATFINFIGFPLRGWMDINSDNFDLINERGSGRGEEHWLERERD